MRYHPAVGLQHLRGLAQVMTWKTALGGSPVRSGAIGRGAALVTALADPRAGPEPADHL